MVLRRCHTSDLKFGIWFLLTSEIVQQNQFFVKRLKNAAISYLKLSTINKLEIHKYISNSELSGPHFPAFGLIQSECGRIRTRITPDMDNFYAVESMYEPLVDNRH